MQKQLEKRILEVEKMKQHEQEQKRKAVDAVEKQVSLFYRHFIQVTISGNVLLCSVFVPWLNCVKLSRNYCVKKLANLKPTFQINYLIDQT